MGSERRVVDRPRQSASQNVRLDKKIESKDNKRGMEDGSGTLRNVGEPLFLCSKRKKRNEEEDTRSRKICLSERKAAVRIVTAKI